MNNALLPKSAFPRVVIIGGGFGGITLAKKLKNKKFQTILIDRNNFHTFQPLLYQVATGGLEPDSIAFPLRKIFDQSQNIIFRMAEVSFINSQEKYLETSIGKIEYDYCVIATGSTNNFYGLKDIEKNTMPLKSLSEALDLRSLVLQNLEQSLNETENKSAYLNFLVIGGGPTGVEVAGALAELKRHVVPMDYPELNVNSVKIYLVDNNDKVLSTMSEQSSTKAFDFLTNLGVMLKLSTRLLTYDGEVATLSDGETIQTKTVVWSAGVKGQTINGIDASLIESGNRISVDEFNHVKGHTSLFAIGDVALLREKDYPNGHPMVAPVAIQQADLLAKNLQHFQNKKSPARFKYFNKGSMATIGRNKAVVDFGKIHFQGSFAWFTWMFVHLMTLVGFRNRVVVFINWLWNFFSYDRAIRLIVRPFKKRD